MQTPNTSYRNAQRILIAAFCGVLTIDCGSPTSDASVKANRQPLDIPLDSANWNFQLSEKYYSKVLVQLFEDSVISHSEGEEIDRQHVHLWDQDSCKFKEYVFAMADALNHHKKPPAPKEFYPVLQLK